MKIDYFKDEEIFISQNHYIDNLLIEYGMEDDKTTGTPIQSNIKLIKSTEEEIKKFRETVQDYRSAIGLLNFNAVYSTRHNLRRWEVITIS